MAQHAQPDGGPLGPYAISFLRTLVPVIWGHALAYAVSFGIPAAVLDRYQAVVTEALAAVLTLGWYALWRWIETKLPKVDTDVVHFMAMLALGHPAQPSYTTSPVVTEPASLTGEMKPSSLSTVTKPPPGL